MYWWLGFCCVESVVPLPSKSHAQVVGLFDDWSMKLTVSGAFPEYLSASKATTDGTSAWR